MNCCDDNGRCTGGHGCAARPGDRFPDPVRGLGLLAPGAIQRHRRVRRWLGTPAQRRQVVTYLVLVAFLMVLVAGYLIGVRT